jgi:rod shape-determining protein MreC
VQPRAGERATGAFAAVAAALFLLTLLSDLPVMEGPRSAARGLVTPAEAAMTALAGVGGDVFGVFGDIAGLRRDNSQLAAQNAQLRRRLAEAQGALSENEQLRRALAFERSYGHRVQPAQVIGRSPEPLARTLTIDRGSADGLADGMIVSSPAGLVGRLVSVSSHSAQVLTIADPSSRVNAYDAVTGLEGTVIGGGTSLTMELPARANTVLKPGDWVLSSGVGGSYPRGLVVGQVASFRNQDAAAVEYAQLAWPDDYSSLSLVLVITDYRSPLQP